MAASLAVGTGERAPLYMVTTSRQSGHLLSLSPNGRNQLAEERHQEQQGRIVS